QLHSGAMRGDVLTCRSVEQSPHGVGNVVHFREDASFVVACGGEFDGHVEEATGIDHKIRCVHNTALPQDVTVFSPETLVVGTAGHDLALQMGNSVVIERSPQGTG